MKSGFKTNGVLDLDQSKPRQLAQLNWFHFWQQLILLCFLLEKEWSHFLVLKYSFAVIKPLSRRTGLHFSSSLHKSNLRGIQGSRFESRLCHVPILPCISLPIISCPHLSSFLLQKGKTTTQKKDQLGLTNENMPLHTVTDKEWKRDIDICINDILGILAASPNYIAIAFCCLQVLQAAFVKPFVLAAQKIQIHHISNPILLHNVICDACAEWLITKHLCCWELIGMPKFRIYITLWHDCNKYVDLTALCMK